MKRNNIEIQQKNHFIGSWYIDESLLDDLVDYFNTSHTKHKPGKLENGQLSKEKRNSIELTVSPKEIQEGKLDFFQKYFAEVSNCYKDYVTQWEYLGENLKKIYVSKFEIEKFLISGHHIDYHCDRKNILSSHKAFSWITFLNDVKKDEGSLYFKYFDLSIQPKKGLTLIWPSDWTHVHRQESLKTQDKFIIKGNFQFTNL